MDSEEAGPDQKQPDGGGSGARVRVRPVPRDLQPGDQQWDALQSLERISGLYNSCLKVFFSDEIFTFGILF